MLRAGDVSAQQTPPDPLPPRTNQAACADGRLPEREANCQGQQTVAGSPRHHDWQPAPLVTTDRIRCVSIVHLGLMTRTDRYT